MTHNYRLGRVVSAVISEENPVSSTISGADAFKLTYLEVGFRFQLLVLCLCVCVILGELVDTKMSYGLGQ